MVPLGGEARRVADSRHLGAQRLGLPRRSRDARPWIRRHLARTHRRPLLRARALRGPQPTALHLVCLPHVRETLQTAEGRLAMLHIRQVVSDALAAQARAPPLIHEKSTLSNSAGWYSYTEKTVRYRYDLTQEKLDCWEQRSIDRWQKEKGKGQGKHSEGQNSDYSSQGQ